MHHLKQVFTFLYNNTIFLILLKPYLQKRTNYSAMNIVNKKAHLHKQKLAQPSRIITPVIAKSSTNSLRQ